MGWEQWSQHDRQARWGENAGGGGPPASVSIPLPFFYPLRTLQVNHSLSNVSLNTATGKGWADGENTAFYFNEATGSYDANSWRPSGSWYTTNSSSSTNANCYWKFPNDKVIKAGIPGFRIAACFHSNAWDTQFQLMATAGATSDTAYFGGLFDPNFNQDMHQAFAKISGVGQTYLTIQSGNTTAWNRWCWLQLEFDLLGGNTTVGLLRAEDSSQITSQVGSHVGTNLEGVTALPQDLDHIRIASRNGVGGWKRLNCMWVGALTDAWPTDTMPTTATEDWP